MSVVYNLVGGAFAHMTAHFAVHPLDRRRAATYLEAAVRAGITWQEAEQDIRDYLTTQNCTPDWINDEVKRATPYLQPWLT